MRISGRRAKEGGSVDDMLGGAPAARFSAFQQDTAANERSIPGESSSGGSCACKRQMRGNMQFVPICVEAEFVCLCFERN